MEDSAAARRLKNAVVC